MHPLQYPIGPFSPSAGPLSGSVREELIRRIAAVPAKLRAALAAVPDARLDVPYREGGWTPRQMAHHLADAHLHGFLRMKLALTEGSGVALLYDQERWAERPDVTGVSVEHSVRILEGLHARWARMLEEATPEEWSHAIRHPEQGELDADRLLQLYAWHGDHHVAQIEGVARS